MFEMRYASLVLVSLILSILSVLLATHDNFDEVSTQEEVGTWPSPWREEIERMLFDAQEFGFDDEGLDRFKLLLEKENSWLENEREKDFGKSSQKRVALADWKRRSNVVAPLVAVVWGVAYLLFYARKSSYSDLVILIVPILMLPSGIFPVLEVGLISTTIALIIFWQSKRVRKRVSGTGVD